MSTESLAELPLGERAFIDLRGKILRCEYGQGKKLKIDSLQQELGYSSSPLREALNRLTVEGLVTSDDRRGFFAAPMSQADLEEITRLRLMLDREALSESMDKGGDEWEAEIIAAYHKLVKIEERHESGPLSLDDGWTKQHKDFHLALVSACTSPKLLKLCSDLFDQSERYRRLSIQYRTEPRKKSQEHRLMMESVIARDKAKALELLEQHIEKTAANVIQVLDKVPSLQDTKDR
jgi:DNA-binding GntR family transcriptional regulator